MKTNILKLFLASIILIISTIKLSADSDDGTLYFKMIVSSVAKQNSIEKNFIGRPGIIDVYIDRSNDLFSIMFDPFRLTEAEIFQMIEKAGYQISYQKNEKITLKEAFFNVNLKDNFEVKNIENLLKLENYIVDAYYDLTRHQLNILYVSNNFNDQENLIKSLVKCGFQNPVFISNFETKNNKFSDTKNINL